MQGSISISISISSSIRISTAYLSYRATTKWKKFDFLRLAGGCFSKWARPIPGLQKIIMIIIMMMTMMMMTVILSAAYQ